MRQYYRNSESTHVMGSINPLHLRFLIVLVLAETGGSFPKLADVSQSFYKGQYWRKLAEGLRTGGGRMAETQFDLPRVVNEFTIWDMARLSRDTPSWSLD